MVVLLASSLAGCQPEAEETPLVFSPEETRAILKLSPLPGVPPSPTNAFADNREAALLGQRLFYDPRLSVNSEIACATCHDPAHGFSDGKQLSEGIETLDRHSQALWNVAYQRWYFWDGRADSLWAQGTQPLQDEREMGAPPYHLWAALRADPGLLAEYEAVFGSFSEIGKTDGPPLERFLANLGKALEAYQRRIVSTDSPFDRYVAAMKTGDVASTESPISESAQRGLKIFVGRGRCILCHAGPNLSDGEFHNIGLPKHPDLPRDQGRFAGIRKVQTDPFNGLGEFSDAHDPENNVKLRYLVVKMNNLGEFKTPTLRHVAETPPYMHDGRFAKLPDVINFYSELPGEPANGHREETLEALNLSKREKADLEAFLRSLTGAPLDKSLTRRPPAR